MNPERLEQALTTAADATGSRLIDACHIGTDAAAKLAAYVREHCGTRCLVASDANTREAAGELLMTALGDAGLQAAEKQFGAGPLDATEELGNAVASAGADCDCFIALGAGTIGDLAKHAGNKLGKPAVVFATAASMNGYTSGITALKVRGLKRTIPCQPARGVFADPEVVAKAPQRLTAAGLADYLSKCSSSADWYAASSLRNEFYDPNALQFYEGMILPLLDSASRIGTGDPDAVADLLEALMLSGLSMLVAGSSSPASGGEHLISHFLDMKAALYGTPHDLHGAQVGVGTIYCLDLWQRILACDPDSIDPESLAAAQPDEASIETWIRQDWGAVGDEVIAQWREKAQSADFIRAELRLFQERHGELCAGLSDHLLPPEVVSRAIQASGGPITPEELDAPAEEFEKAKQRARFIRNRFTVLDLAAELDLDR